MESLPHASLLVCSQNVPTVNWHQDYTGCSPLVFILFSASWIFTLCLQSRVSSSVEISFFFFLTSFLESNCFTMVCQFLLYNKVNQLYIYIYPHIPSLLRLPPTLPIPPLQVVTKPRADLPVLCGCFPLAIYFTFGSAYMSVLLSHFVPAYPLVLIH